MHALYKKIRKFCVLFHCLQSMKLQASPTTHTVTHWFNCLLTSCRSTEMWFLAGLKKAVPSTSFVKHQNASASSSRAASKGANRSVIPEEREGGREERNEKKKGQREEGGGRRKEMK